VVFQANGVIHEFIPNRKITRTFEMENTPFAVQLEFLEFESLADDKSKLNMHIVFRSVELRDQLLKLPFAQGITGLFTTADGAASAYGRFGQDLRTRQFDRSENLLKTAVHALPNNLAARNNLAVVYLLTGRAKEAADLLRPVATPGSHKAALLNNYGLALRVLARPAVP